MIEPSESKRHKNLFCLTIATMVNVADAIEKGIREFIACVSTKQK